MQDPRNRKSSATRMQLCIIVSLTISHQSVYTLSNELTFKLVEEFKRELIFCRKRLFTNDSLH